MTEDDHNIDIMDPEAITNDLTTRITTTSISGSIIQQNVDSYRNYGIAQCSIEPDSGFDFDFGGGEEFVVEEEEFDDQPVFSRKVKARFIRDDSLDSLAWAERVFSPVMREEEDSEEGEEGKEEETKEVDESIKNLVHSIYGQRSATKRYGSRMVTQASRKSSAKRRRVDLFSSSEEEEAEEEDDGDDSYEEEAEFTPPASNRIRQRHKKPKKPLRYPKGHDFYDDEAREDDDIAADMKKSRRSRLSLARISQLDEEDAEFYQRTSPRKKLRKFNPRTKSVGTFLDTVDKTSFARVIPQEIAEKEVVHDIQKDSPVKKITSRVFDAIDLENSQLPRRPPLISYHKRSPHRSPTKQRQHLKPQPNSRLPRLDLVPSGGVLAYRLEVDP